MGSRADASVVLGLQHTEQAMALATDACGEEQLVERTGGGAVAKAERPQPADEDGVAVLVRQRAAECSADGVERVDTTVAEISDEQVSAETTELLGRLGK